jgi:hypothetical protein
MHVVNWLIVGMVSVVVLSAVVTLGTLLLDWYRRARDGRGARVRALLLQQAIARHRVFLQQDMKKPPGEAA